MAVGEMYYMAMVQCNRWMLARDFQEYGVLYNDREEQDTQATEIAVAIVEYMESQ